MTFQRWSRSGPQLTCRKRRPAPWKAGLTGTCSVVAGDTYHVACGTFHMPLDMPFAIAMLRDDPLFDSRADLTTCIVTHTPASSRRYLHLLPDTCSDFQLRPVAQPPSRAAIQSALAPFARALCVCTSSLCVHELCVCARALCTRTVFARALCHSSMPLSGSPLCWALALRTWFDPRTWLG
jgi:hypothetical protein